ncbi:hypothetical protein DB41_FN00070 [Neochlamydia sp. TUME1]|nr:hypothetical protein DB41_FN00070 [Neochlamydia sp. TUME1]
MLQSCRNVPEIEKGYEKVIENMQDLLELFLSVVVLNKKE